MPKDPMLLLSLVNTYLRDQYSDLDALCEDREWDKEELSKILASAGFEYMEKINQFR